MSSFRSASTDSLPGSSIRCKTIIKFGPRSGKKCGRKYCIYHKPQSVHDSFTSSDIMNEPVDDPPVICPSIRISSISPMCPSSSVSFPSLSSLPESVFNESLPDLSCPLPTHEAPDLIGPLHESDTESIVYEKDFEVVDENEVSGNKPDEVVLSDIPKPVTKVDRFVDSANQRMDQLVDHLDDIEAGVTDLQNHISALKHPSSPDTENVKPAEWCSAGPVVKIYSDKCIMVFDTETTGLPPDNVPPQNLLEWQVCRLVEISWMIFSPTGVILSTHHALVRPDGFTIPEDATQIHGISHADAYENGISIYQMFRMLADTFAEYNIGTLVAHNVRFDDRVVLSELTRYAHSLPNSTLLDTWKGLTKECTMGMAKFLGVSGKNMKLAVLYEKCFDKKPEGTAHTSISDTKWCSEIYFWLRDHSTKRTYLSVHYDDKDIVKYLGARWDSESKLWYVLTCHRFSKHLMKWFPLTKVTQPLLERPKAFSEVDMSVEVPTKDEEVMRFLGAMEANGKWYIPVGNVFHQYMTFWFQSA